MISARGALLDGDTVRQVSAGERRDEPGGVLEEERLEPLARVRGETVVDFDAILASRDTRVADRKPRGAELPRRHGRERRRRVERGAEPEARAERVGGVGDARMSSGLAAKRRDARRERRVSEPSAARDEF